MRKIVFRMIALLAIMLVTGMAQAQERTIGQTTQTIRGQVCDVASGEPMVGVTVMVDDRTDKSIPEDTANPFSCHFDMNVGYAFSVKYAINKQHTARHFILEYLQIRSFNGQTFDLRTHEIVNLFTSMTFPNIAYRIEF